MIATFSGKIIETIDFTKDGVYDVRAKGNLVIHGKKQARIIPSKIQIEKGVLKIASNFTIPLADHDIKVPQLVTEKNCYRNHREAERIIDSKIICIISI